MTISFDNQVAIVTGAGNGLGRSHALELAKRGAKVVVNDLGDTLDGKGNTSDAACKVVAEIEAAGGEAIANGANVAKFEEVSSLVQETMAKWGRIDILVNNAGILRDKSFSKMTVEDFQAVVDVHLMGTFNCCKAVWDIMKEQHYGRIIMTTSSSGLYGNFGQTNYGAAKMGVIGLMNTLVLEGAKHNIHVNALSPTAATRMTEDLIKDEATLSLLAPDSVSKGLLALCHVNAPNRTILGSGAGNYAIARIMETSGIFLNPDEQTPENIITHWKAIADPASEEELTSGAQQTEKYISRAMTSRN